jgi:hypothetical protein
MRGKPTSSLYAEIDNLRTEYEIMLWPIAIDGISFQAFLAGSVFYLPVGYLKIDNHDRTI